MFSEANDNTQGPQRCLLNWHLQMSCILLSLVGT